MRGRAPAAAPVVIQAITREDRRFYALLGPFFGSREAARELGGPIWDEPEKRWLVALQNGRAIGICAWLPGPKRTRLLSAYVLPAHRRQGVYEALFHERLRLVGDGPLEATVAPASLGKFERAGFRVVNQRGRYRHVERASRGARVTKVLTSSCRLDNIDA